MNFLAHFAVATRLQPALSPLPAYVVGTALPDLLPLADQRAHLRLFPVSHSLPHCPGDHALRGGVLSHLAADIAFHRSESFADAQTEAKKLLDQAGFKAIRVRRFFVAHILVEMALDAALLRAEPALGEQFYAALRASEGDHVVRWTEAVVARPLPELPRVLSRFAESRYLLHYGTDEGVAQALSHLCARARQATFDGENQARLVQVVGEMVDALKPKTEDLLREAS